MQALQEYEMISQDDKVLICLSGSHDSLSLLHVLHQYQGHVKEKGINFTLGAALINSSRSVQPYPLINYLQVLGVPYICEENKNEGRFVKNFSEKMLRVA